jgi:hypothetical protein
VPFYRNRYNFLACVFAVLLMQPSTQAAETMAVNEIVAKWLVDACELGDEKKLIEKVTSLGRPGVDALISAHQDGPPLDTLASIEEAATRRYHLRLSVLSDTDTLQVELEEIEELRGEGETDFVRRQLDSFIAGYKSQALNGLRQVGGEQAKVYLDSVKAR